MIIKIIPETEGEKNFQKEVEHKGVKEFFIFGNKKDVDKDTVDFHDWSGSYRYLLGSLHYFHEIVNDERIENSTSKKPETPMPELRIHTVKAEEKNDEPLGNEILLKRGMVQKQDVKAIDVSNLVHDDNEFVEEQKENEEVGQVEAFEDSKPSIILDADEIEKLGKRPNNELRHGLKIIK